MLNKFKKNIEFVMGNIIFDSKPENIFNRKILKFLNEISLEIFKNKKNLIYTDLVSFGFWCRKTNLNKLSKEYEQKRLTIGRGTVLHIVPSNVPMNFSYSLAFGLLSGNYNIVRLPSKKFAQINIICKIISKILKRNEFKVLKKKICLIRYEKSDEISNELSRNVDARLLWGGDLTINQFKKYTTSPRCIDLSFSNRYSVSIINLNDLSKCNNNEFEHLVQKFYNDCYLMDQQGCSSPQAIIWIGKNHYSIKKKFWKTLNNIVDLKYDYDLSVANKKILSLSNIAISTNLKFKSNYENFKIVKLSVKQHFKNIDQLQCYFGTFVEIDVKNLNEINKIINKKYQTITYFGSKHEEIEKIILKYGLKGIDRIVPIGRAFDMGPVWDGYDIIYSLSRIVSN